ncbi:MAG: hypothetical protein SF097_24385 [Acidobacteriota bacterium]|nr:hypothetical protein [Acidobacteriota bacterium]
MGKKYVDILDKGFRSDAALYAESIPHLLHWDLAYFWVLERDAHLRPAEWGEQINAWRYLVALLLTDQLDIESDPIKEPFLSLTKSYGIDEVRWLKLKNEGDCVGALSPTVLVRPLPDYSRGDLRRWVQKLPHPEEHKPDLLAHFVKLAIQHLEQLQKEGKSKSPVPSILANILEREFKAKEMADPPEGAFQPLPILKQISWVQENYESCLEPIDLLVGWQSDVPVGRVYIPRCEQCGAPLTRPQSSAPIEIHNEGASFILDCSRPTCGRPNSVSLEQFLIWVRDREVVVWDRQNVFPVPAKGFPPMPTIIGREVQFEWQPAQLPGAERTNRFLRFQFPDNKQLVQRKLSEIFYHKLLVPGELNEFKGLPFQLEWREAIENFADVHADPDSVSVKVAYNRIKVRGLPEPINWVYGSLSLKQAPDLAIGIYPNPQVVPEKWKWYRLFLHGKERQQYRLQAPETKEILPWLMESTSGFPKLFSVHSSDNVSVSFYKQPERTFLSSESPARLDLGVDFGTTNTVVYFLPPGKDFDQLLTDPQEHCVEPRRFAEIIQWLARTNASSSQSLGDFLPGDDYGKKGAARFIIPTVLWEMDDRYLICWNPDSAPPQADNFKLPATAVGDFKLKSLPNAAVWRQAFLREAMLLTLPWALTSSKLRTSNLTVSLGFAFPLALGGPAREEMVDTLARTSRTLDELTGFKFETNAISESAACVKLLGSPNSYDTFLVADMGGGTIDLALFTANEADPDQIGSVQFAGERFLHILATKKQLDQLKLGDSIRQGNCSYGADQTANLLLRRFVGIAFEFLRTMIAAYRQQKPDQTIHLVLAGNGWHLAEVFNAGSASYTTRQLYNQVYAHLVKSLGDDKLLLSDPLHQLPSSKHLVAVGALKHAVTQGSSHLDPDKFAPSRLPAGRGLIFTTPPDDKTDHGKKREEEKKIGWFDLVGEPVRFDVHSPEALRKMNLRIDFMQMTPLKDPWRAHMLELFGVSQEQKIPYPEEMQLQEQIRLAIPGGHVPTLGKGPLQLILENYWAEWLKK